MKGFFLGKAISFFEPPAEREVFGDRVGGRVAPSASHNTVRAVPHTAFHLNSPHGRQIVQSEPREQGVRDCFAHVERLGVVPWSSAIIG